jgi:signal transduction histidine kinase
MDRSGLIAIHSRRVPLGSLLAPNVRRSIDPADIMIPHEPNPKVRAWVEAARLPAEVVQIVVADSGPGVPAGDAERIFEPFFTTREPGKGTGLGLAIVARIADNVSGTVWVQRAREGGAAFVLLLPVATSNSTSAVSASPVRPLAGSVA